MARGWTQERRLAQAANIRATKPWEKSTGPTTSAGKAKVSQNAVKHGLRGGYLRKAAEFLAEQNKIMKEIFND